MSDFHFLRPLWFLALVPVTLLAWRIWRSSDDRQIWRGIISDELLSHLLVGTSRSRRFGPVFLLILGWTVSVIALTGPTWKREPTPFSDEIAAVVIVLKVTPSMLTEDVQPNRLSRSVQKVKDLLKERPGAKSGLVAYAGSAHQVLPLTTDSEIIGTFAEELNPTLFPREGDAAASALLMASQILARSKEPGWILWIADDISPEQQAEIRKEKADFVPISLLVPESVGSELESMKTAAGILGAKRVVLTPDDQDIHELMRRTTFSDVTSPTGGDRWQDAGYFLVPVVALIVLFWFRRGWVIRDSIWRVS